MAARKDGDGVRNGMGSGNPTGATARPNILLISCDQLSAGALRAWGNEFARTPAIDGLVARGLRFSQAYSNCPLCQPSRASFWTSQYPHETGVRSNGKYDPVTPVPASTPTLGSVFQAAGYTCRHFGKTHDAGALRGFEIVAPAEEAVEAVEPWPLNYDTFQDRAAQRAAVEFLAGYADDAPFIAVADFNNPHNICGWVGANQGEHQDPPCDEAELPPAPPNLRLSEGEWARRPLPIQYLCCAHNRQAQMGGWEDESVRHYLRAYHHYMARVDAEVAKVLAALAARPDAANTLVVLFADHGDSMGGRFMATKHCSFYEETMRVPLVFAGPGVVNGSDAGGVARPGLTSLLDLAPTLIDYAGLQAPATMRGRSLLPWFGAIPPAAPPNEAVYAQWHTEWGTTVEPGRMLHTGRYKYTRYREGDGEELYDLETDPGETRTLIQDSAYAEVLATMRDRFNATVTATGDDFASLPWKADPRWRSHQVGLRHHRGLTAAQVSPT